MKIIEKKEFAKKVLEKNVETFVIYVKSLKFNLILIYLAKKVQIALLLIKQIEFIIEYLNFSNVFLEEQCLILLAIIKFN